MGGGAHPVGGVVELVGADGEEDRGGGADELAVELRARRAAE